jgi:hypothetical protein
MQKFAVGFVVLVALASLTWFVILPHILYSGPVARNTPLMQEIAGMHDICTKLDYYAEEHHTLPGADTGKTLDSLVAAGILSEQDGGYLRDHHIEFRGFDPAGVGPDVVVLETVFTNTRSPRRIIGYADGHVVTKDLEIRK